MTIKKGNPHRDAETKAMKQTGITSRVEFRREKFKAQKDIEEFEENFAHIKEFINESVAELLDMNKIHHDHFEEKIEEGILIMNHYIVIPDIGKEVVLNIVKNSFNMMMNRKDMDISGTVDVRFLAAGVN